MTNAGEYVFLLEKGRDYSFGTRSFLPDVTYAAVDDIGAAVFEGVLSDAGANLDVSYEWRTSHDNLEIAAPNVRKTEVSPKAGTDSGNYDLSVTATFGQHKLTSSISGYYYTNEESVVKASLSISAPKVLLLESNIITEPTEGLIKIALQLAEGVQGELSLECVSGSENIQLNGATTWQVEGSVTKEVDVVGCASSESKDDVKFIIRFTPSDGEAIEQEATLTVVKLWHEAVALVPENILRNCFGIFEKVNFFWEPADYNILLECDNGNVIETEVGHCQVEVASESGTTTVALVIDNLRETSLLEVFAPQDVWGVINTLNFGRQDNIAGGIQINFRVYVKPLNVSFAHLSVQEVPRVATDATGYFAQAIYANLLDHGKNGAGRWTPINVGNVFFDAAGVNMLAQPWLSGGAFTWPIPCAWRFSDKTRDVTQQFTYYTQRFELDANGTVRVKKFRYCAERATNNFHRVMGDSQ